MSQELGIALVTGSFVLIGVVLNHLLALRRQRIEADKSLAEKKSQQIRADLIKSSDDYYRRFFGDLDVKTTDDEPPLPRNRRLK